MLGRPIRHGWVALLGVVVFGGCGGEVPEPIDLDATSTTGLDLADPNAAERDRMQELARQQCLDDPDRTRGVVRLVDPETDQALAEVVLDCEEVRDP